MLLHLKGQNTCELQQKQQCGYSSQHFAAVEMSITLAPFRPSNQVTTCPAFPAPTAPTQVNTPNNLRNLATAARDAGYSVVYKGKMHVSTPATFF